VLPNAGKWLCGIDNLAQDHNCSIFSLGKRACRHLPRSLHSLLNEGICLPGIGSHNEFDFEVAMAEHTGCHLHTFDCTVELKDLNIPSSVQDRMTFHPTCLGADG
jgi:hypothetical protein